MDLESYRMTAIYHKMTKMAIKQIKFGLVTVEMAFSNVEDNTAPKIFCEVWDQKDVENFERVNQR